MIYFYRFVPSTFFLTLLIVCASSHAETFTIDLYGEDGRPPHDGTCCVSLPRTSSPYETPHRGDDATAGTPGEDANSLDLRLRDSESQDDLQGHIVLSGTILNSTTGLSVGEISKNLSLTTNIFIDAHGGEGARGGNGGQGQDGCHGDDGSDATSSSNGTDGDDGCDSGDGGNASPAQPGGNGGRVRVFIPAGQTHLALLVNANTEAGDGGDPGRPGQPGNPGDGGDGGSSHTYISGYVDEPACPPPPSSSGSGGSGYDSSPSGGGVHNLGYGYDSFESNAEPFLRNLLYQTAQITGDVFNELIGVSPAYACGGRDPVYDTNPGGDDGADGDPGTVGRSFPSSGVRGNNGRMEFIVIETDRSQTTYRQPFNLELLSYQIHDSIPGGNGDGVFEPNETLTISQIRVKNTEDMPSPQRTDVILSIQSSNWILADPVDRVVVPQLNGGESVTLPHVYYVKIKKAFEIGRGQNWSVSDTIVPLGGIPRIQRTLRGLSLPQTVSISFPISISPLQTVTSIGPGETASLQWRITNLTDQNFAGLPGMERRLQTTLRQIEGSSNAIDSISLANDEDASTHYFLQTVTELRARESLIVSGTINFSAQAEPYTSVSLQSTLGLDILGTNEMATIMSQSHRISIAQTYRYNPEASILLLTTSSTSRTEYLAWMNVLQNLGLHADIWDVSYNQELNLVRDFDDAEKGLSLMKNYRGKTIVLLNSNPATRDQNFSALRLLLRSQFYEAALGYGINFYVLGGTEQELISQVVGMHLTPTHLQKTPANKDAFLQAIRSRSINENGIYLNQPDQTSFQEIQRLAHEHPDLNYSLIFTKQNNEVRLALYPSLSLLSGSMLAIPAEESQRSSPTFIESDKNLRPFILSLGFREKITAFNFLAPGTNTSYLNATTSTLIHDVIEKAYLFKMASAEVIKSEQMQELNFLAETLGTQILSASGQESLARVHAAIAFIAEVSRDNALQTIANQLQNKINEDTKKTSDRYLIAYRNFAKQRKDALPTNYNALFDAYKMFTLPAIGNAITNTNMMFIKSPIVFGEMIP